MPRRKRNSSFPLVFALCTVLTACVCLSHFGSIFSRLTYKTEPLPSSSQTPTQIPQESIEAVGLEVPRT